MSISITRDEHEKGPVEPFQILNKQPGFAYRLINRNERNLQRKLSMGYQLVQATDPEKLANNPSTPIKRGDGLDSTEQISDLILARIPLEIAEQHREHVKEQNRRRRMSSKEIMEAAAANNGTRAYSEEEGKGSYRGSMNEDEFFDGGGSGKGGDLSSNDGDGDE